LPRARAVHPDAGDGRAAGVSQCIACGLLIYIGLVSFVAGPAPGTPPPHPDPAPPALPQPKATAQATAQARGFAQSLPAVARRRQPSTRARARGGWGGGAEDFFTSEYVNQPAQLALRWKMIVRAPPPPDCAAGAKRLRRHPETGQPAGGWPAACYAHKPVAPSPR
jgi:hypothetical protein